MKHLMTATLIAVMAAAGIAQAESASADAKLEMVLLLNFAEELGLGDYELLEVLQGYKEYRGMMDSYIQQREEKKTALAAAVANNESGTVIMGLTRDLMNLDTNILRLKQSSVNEASSVLGAKAVAQLYLLVSDLDAAKAALIAELTGATAEAPAAVETCPEEELTENPAEALLELTSLFLGKLAAKDLDQALSAISEKFEHYEYGDKEELKFFLDQAILMGYLDDLKIVTDDTEVKIEGDKAVIYPIDVEGLFGSFTLELTAEKENGKWMVTSLDVFGI